MSTNFLAPFAAAYAPADEAVLPDLLQRIARDGVAQKQIDDKARSLIEGIRERAGSVGGMEDFLRDYGLSTKEGLALMVMAEALLRVPDAATQDALIADKITAGNWEDTEGADTWFVSAATWGLGLSSKIVRPDDSPSGLLSHLTKRIGGPAVRQGVRQSMRYLGHQFVLGQTIEEGLKRAGAQEAKGYRYSYDMLGEGARTWDDAKRYAASYADAIEEIGRKAGNKPLPDRPGISIKLSALHPRYTARNRDAVLRELVPEVLKLVQSAKSFDLNLTIDAEEADRLELSLDVIDAVFSDPSLRGWDGFGLAIQAYQKRAIAVIDWVADLCRKNDGRMMVRLVKGAYWDSEVKHAQVEGAADFPVFTRKAATDVSYTACARQMLLHRDVLYPQFATHNALTVATILAFAGDGEKGGYEFQRLHGMGEELFEQITEGRDGVPCRIYAPVGHHRDLLAYLVRRLLENGANSSFVAQVGDKDVPIDDLLTSPASWLDDGAYRHPDIQLPRRLYAPRKNSRGIEFGSRVELKHTLDGMAAASLSGSLEAFGAEDVEACMAKAQAAFPAWRGRDVKERASILERAADLLESDTTRIMGVLAKEAGKTVDDGIAEVREAVDFLRYYAAEARRIMVPRMLPGPVGEDNAYSLTGRGVVVTIAPWNFPLAIFLGQVSAALAAGNAVVAKPAPQTPIIAAEALALLHKAGVPKDALILAPGGAETGQALVGDPRVAAIAFTGSTATAKAINLQLAQKPGAIIPFIAETGGTNAMIADATALPEQVTDDVILSAFRSAGQRCSACRILYVQEDVAERMLTMIQGSAATLEMGDPMLPQTDIGPVIDADALSRLRDYVVEKKDQIVWQGKAPEGGLFMAPTIIRLRDDEVLDREIFGPVLHVKTYKAGKLDAVIDEINSTGFGLTFALHSRIQAVIDHVTARVGAGNVYVNRNQIGAIVESQPFGGQGLSGTGPKAGGPLYLTRFVQERVVSTDTTAAGGNASLIALEDH
ncbi:L-glutamate gamma-semialdehyde dehydrogenase [Pseudahrensia aquimaris]|uniref:Bifunctional protein PutA n=1 Tax=Pseudahrensia aquimaris TaxID=744461 RepID=A0ABW3FAF2_9HYPH